MFDPVYCITLQQKAYRAYIGLLLVMGGFPGTIFVKFCVVVNGWLGDKIA